MKGDSSTRTLPVYVVTVVDNQAKALALGADAFHPKPIDRSWLLQKLDATLQQKEFKRVLIVDDDEASRYVIKAALGDFEFRFIEASSGNEGFRLAREARPDLIILDLVMPDLSGFEILSRLKQDGETASIPIIINTSKDLDKSDRELLAPAVGIVAKEGQSRDSVRAKFSEAIEMAGIAPLRRGV